MNLLKHYLWLKGRSGRLEFFVTVFVCNWLVPYILKKFIPSSIHNPSLLVVILIVLEAIIITGIVLLTFWASLMATCRRLHDLGLSAALYGLWWVIVLVFLFTWPIALLGIVSVTWTWLCFYRGNRGPNQYGPAPDLFYGVVTVEPASAAAPARREPGEQGPVREQRINFKL